MPPRKATGKREPTQIGSVRHKDKRLNIPTEELRDFVAADELAPVPVEYHRPLLYPRDPDADPQLVWRGKDQQDEGPLIAPAVPLYIQEKIDPKALVEDLRRSSADATDISQPALFGDFDGLEGYDQVEFYEHPANWSNRLILGDALLVMNSLAEKERLRGQVQMIYMDPPYGIEFRSNWQVSTRKRDVKDGKDASRQPEQVKAFRDTWQGGIHSYLTYLRDRLVIARDLLTQTGSLFVQIGEENLHLVRSLLDEVFAPENFVTMIWFKKKKMPLGETFLFTPGDYILWFAKDRARAVEKFRRLYLEKDSADPSFNYVELDDGARMSLADFQQAGLDASFRRFQSMDLRSSGRTESCVFPVEFEGRTFMPGQGRSWKTNEEGMQRLLAQKRLFAPGDTLRYVLYLDDYPISELSNIWTDTQGANSPVYVVQTANRIVERCMLMTTDPGDLVLDPTCGSGTTAFVAEQWGRRWITIDTSRVAVALARTRLTSAVYPYYLLADSKAGAEKEAELGDVPISTRDFQCDVRQGFVYRRAPHVTLGSIAQTEIRDELDPAENDAPGVVASSKGGQELLVDQPYEDSRKVRVSGRFTVESLSPHRTLEAESKDLTEASSFVSTVLENLRTSGVQNTFRGERLTFSTIEPTASDGNLQASGTMEDSEGAVRTIAIAIGPQYGTVSPDMVKDAAREALRGTGYDMLVYCGFAYEAYASETAKEFAPAGNGFATAEGERMLGKLRVLLARINPDLAMSGELLKKTGTGNLFTVFGEPDIAIEEVDGGYRVEVHGVDVYDPTTGQVRSSSTDDIACWFIDTDYDGDQFFVRHAYFTGTDKPYEKLRTSLHAEIDSEAWAALYRTTSRPFDAPSTGRIAIKVINHYGDEVLQVYDVKGKPAARAPRRVPAPKR